MKVTRVNWAPVNEERTVAVRFTQVCPPPPNTVAATKIQVPGEVSGDEVRDVVADDDTSTVDTDDIVEAEAVVPEAKVVRGPARKAPRSGPAARVKA